MRRGLLIALSSFALSALPTVAAVPVAADPAALPAAPPLPAAAPVREEAAQIPFKQRYRAVQHGGIVRAANSSITCVDGPVRPAPSCADAQHGGTASNGDYRMFYTDVDDDPNTYNSSRAEVRLPQGARVTYARLYWGGNLRVGEQKPPQDNGRVLIAEPGGRYKEVLSDTLIGHRTATGTDAFHASADVTRLVRDSGSGLYTVAQVNVAMGHSKVGSWGGWTLVVAYEDPNAPRRVLTLWDGFRAVLKNRAPVTVQLDGMAMPRNAKGQAGFVSYDGDRGLGGDYAQVFADRNAARDIADSASPGNDVMNSSIAGAGGFTGNREPAHANTLGYDSDVMDLGPALASGGTSLSLRFGTRGEGYHLGALFTQTDVRR
ncbi:DUF3344 domain-containing protein [Streptomyces sp. GC420]|uniref:DUF3344 domain-containing protein n=1 Tax=Streptomyces sp. GC420 TaxID=2697568 RepID=UPI001FB60BEF|nr:DUF3344 domain-containing protein [Streptomyces sp. GC420]